MDSLWDTQARTINISTARRRPRRLNAKVPVFPAHSTQSKDDELPQTANCLRKERKLPPNCYTKFDNHLPALRRKRPEWYGKKREGQQNYVRMDISISFKWFWINVKVKTEEKKKNQGRPWSGNVCTREREGAINEAMLQARETLFRKSLDLALTLDCTHT
jgi:hypothetical protein